MLLLLFFKKNVFITIGFILFAKVLFKKYLYRIIYILEGKKGKKKCWPCYGKKFYIIWFMLCWMFPKKRKKTSHFSHTTYSFYDYHFSYSKSIDILRKAKKKRRETNFDINTDGFVLKTFSYLSCENKKRKVHLLLWIRKAN